MPRQVEWSELRTGMICAAVIAVVVAATLIFARVGSLHGKKVTLYVVTDDATGVLAGTEVWLAGQKTGLVTDVKFREPSSDTTERLIITMEFLENALSNVRRDSYAQVRAGSSLIGTPVIYVSAGSLSSAPLKSGDTLHTQGKTAITDVTSQVGQIMPAIDSLAANVKILTRKAGSPTSTVGSLRAYGMPAMPELGAGVSRVARKATNGNGTIGLALRHDLPGRAMRVMAQTDSIRTLLASNRGTLGRFRRDTTLMKKAAGVMAELDTLRALASNPVASIAGAHPDSALVRELARSRALLDSLMKDVKKRPLRYIRL